MHLQELKSFTDIASSLDVTAGHLRRLLFEEKNNLYFEFEIPKKNGSLRKIYAPNDSLLFIQKRLSAILSSSVKLHDKAYGFINKRSIVDNAQLHIRKNVLLNIDLENFFPSISFGRVRSMFMNYFRLDKNVATTLTNICCHPGGFLPQGSPTSPVISNILCKTLDKDLDRLAKNSFGATYSRYADDITFSTKTRFNENIVIEENGKIVLGSSLTDIINRNGFKINPYKTRLQKANQHQEVTGIIVNKKLNVDRRYIRKIRAMLYSIEENSKNLTIPLEKFTEAGYKGDSIENMLRVIKGMINYVSMVKGKHDTVFEQLAKRHNAILKELEITKVNPIFIPPKMRLEESVCVIKETSLTLFSKDKTIMETTDYGQGSGFLLKNYGILSNYHVFEFLIEEILSGLSPIKNEFFAEMFFGERTSKHVKAKIEKYSKEHDLVLLIPEDLSLLNSGLEKFQGVLEKNADVYLLGYPDFEDGDQMKFEKGQYLRTVNSDGIKKYEISQIILALQYLVLVENLRIFYQHFFCKKR
ncbi:reverse transcriptase domain-containing protein [Enterococcus sp. NPDC086594]|uniref:reverse transcriptase domain-containing protein n=1 Tax=Enterococcus sp. NPDC086594 TaxID=3363992 RepID=UPI003802DE0A